ncbi:MAG TPA: AraC family transcriptional regulator [Nevskia sp.]|nr:AraC family transcriptional regulator [Rudaea sp.]HET7797070.1 AraC family transcriptional regulator [Nevskia sp.]HSC12404.1 AraC family transcriptional regulator [Rhodanobacteraceae bacterium]
MTYVDKLPAAAHGNGSASMKVFAIRAIAGSRTGLDASGVAPSRDDRMSVVLCERGTVLTIPPGVVSLACPILGGAGVMSGEWSVQLGKADIWVGDALSRHDIIVSPRGACVVVAGTPAAWSSLGRNGGAGARSATVLFPAIHRFVPALGRRLLRLVRHCLRDAQLAGDKHVAHQLAGLVDDLQSGFAPMIERCPGSCLNRKKAVFLRLQRVRNYICACAHQDIDVAKLALMANYSVGHFITTFRSVFEETPYSNLSRYRLECASTLLSGSSLGIADIAQAIGFQSRSSFTRAIKKHLGSSATQFRESLALVAQPLPAEAVLSDAFIPEIRRVAWPLLSPRGKEPVQR